MHAAWLFEHPEPLHVVSDGLRGHFTAATDSPSVRSLRRCWRGVVDSTTMNTVRPLAESVLTVSPWAWATCRTMNRPSPMLARLLDGVRPQG